MQNYAHSVKSGKIGRSAAVHIARFTNPNVTRFRTNNVAEMDMMNMSCA